MILVEVSALATGKGAGNDSETSKLMTAELKSSDRQLRLDDYAKALA